MKKSIITDLVLGEHPITLREYYSGQFGAMLAASPFLSNEDGIRRAETVAKNAVTYADALIAELEKEENRG